MGPENAEGIISLMANPNLLMKSRQAPPGVLRTSSFNPNPIFSSSGSTQADPLTNLGSSLSNLNLGATQTNNAFNLPGECSEVKLKIVER